MAAPEESEDRPGGDAAAGPEPCSPCRGTGKVVSNLGDKREEITCPWCDGGGMRLPEHDAQARFKEGAPPVASREAPEAEPAAEAELGAEAEPADA